MIISRNNYEAFFLDYIEGNLRADLHEELQLFLQANPDLAAELEEMKSFNEANDFIHAEDEVIFSDKEILKKQESSAQENLMDELLAKELEGDLTKEETALLQKIALGSSVVEKWRKLFALTKLKAGNEQFADKDAVRIPESIDHSSIHELLIAHCEGDLSQDENLMLESLLASDSNLRTELSLYSLTRLNPESISFPEKASLYKKATPVISLRRIYYSVAAAASVALLIAVIHYTDKSSALTLASHNPRVEMKLPSNTSIESVEIAQENKAHKNVSTNTSERLPKDFSPVEQADIAQENSTQKPIEIEQELKTISPLESIKSIEAQNLATLAPKGLEYEIPEMKKVYEQPIIVEKNNQESTTLLAYLGKVATARLQSSEVYSATEKQLGLIANKVSENFKFERIPLESKDVVYLKIGRLELRRKVAQKKDTREIIFWEKAKEMINKVKEK